MAYKIIVSKDGYNALTETNPDNLVFSSDYNTLKYYVQGSVTVNVSVGAGYYIVQEEITHGLGYPPFFKVYALWASTLYSPTGIFYNPVDQLPVNYSSYLGASVDNDKMYFTASGVTDGAINFTTYFKYKLFKNNLGL